ncbi:MAG: aminoglycoside 6-adenylyltransferase [Firmicutes bacterium]|nr:aminoglycoside 6-adenylyltransferase [Bacillota bacterium]
MKQKDGMMERLLAFAKQDRRIRAVTLEGSRANQNVPRDELQDYDITYFVTEMEPFIENPDWLQAFGQIIMMQKPEDMELFPPAEAGFSFLMIFADYSKVDLTLRELADLDRYFQEDKLVKVLLDKDQRIKAEIIPTDEDFHIARPTARSFDDCCNEFWFVSTYVVKGLCRREILFALDHVNYILRPELLRMVAWKVGMEKGFNFSLGKNYKYLEKHISPGLWERLLKTYALTDYGEVWHALWTIQELFREVSQEVAEHFGYAYPDYDPNITIYTEKMYRKYFS